MTVGGAPLDLGRTYKVIDGQELQRPCHTLYLCSTSCLRCSKQLGVPASPAHACMRMHTTLAHAPVCARVPLLSCARPLSQVATKAYLRGGKDGFECLRAAPVLVDGETAPRLATLVQVRACCAPGTWLQGRWSRHQPLLPRP